MDDEFSVFFPYFYIVAMDECLLLLIANAHFMSNVPPSKLPTSSA